MFTRTKITLTVLSEEAIWSGREIPEILRECEIGDYVLASVEKSDETLNGKQMARALLEAGSEPEFFDLDEEGTSIKDET